MQKTECLKKRKLVSVAPLLKKKKRMLFRQPFSRFSESPKGPWPVKPSFLAYKNIYALYIRAAKAIAAYYALSPTTPNISFHHVHTIIKIIFWRCDFELVPCIKLKGNAEFYFLKVLHESFASSINLLPCIITHYKGIQG